MKHTPPPQSANAITMIAPYKHHGMWVFDDPAVGLRQEPFVAGADDFLDRVTAEIPAADKGFVLLFSAGPFPGAQYRLEQTRSEGRSGTWYRSPDLDMDGWLCPALFRYFDEAPEQLWVQVRPKR